MNLFKFIEVDWGKFCTCCSQSSHTVSGQHNIANLAEIKNLLCCSIDACYYLVVGLPSTIQNVLEYLDMAFVDINK